MLQTHVYPIPPSPLLRDLVPRLSLASRKAAVYHLLRGLDVLSINVGMAVSWVASSLAVDEQDVDAILRRCVSVYRSASAPWLLSARLAHSARALSQTFKP
jgi:hypothetical protein